jgi:hypothetical protein
MLAPWSNRLTPLDRWLLESTLVLWEAPMSLRNLMIDRYSSAGSLNRRPRKRWFLTLVRFLSRPIGSRSATAWW